MKGPSRPGPLGPLIYRRPSAGLRKTKWAALAESSKSFFKQIAQSKVCLLLKYLGEQDITLTRLHLGPFWMLLRCVLSLFVVLIFNGLLHFSKGRIWHNKTKPKKKKRLFLPSSREVCLETVAIPTPSRSRKRKKVCGPQPWSGSGSPPIKVLRCGAEVVTWPFREAGTQAWNFKLMAMFSLSWEPWMFEAN